MFVDRPSFACILITILTYICVLFAKYNKTLLSCTCVLFCIRDRILHHLTATAGDFTCRQASGPHHRGATSADWTAHCSDGVAPGLLVSSADVASRSLFLCLGAYSLPWQVFQRPCQVQELHAAVLLYFVHQEEFQSIPKHPTLSICSKALSWATVIWHQDLYLLWTIPANVPACVSTECKEIGKQLLSLK